MEPLSQNKTTKPSLGFWAVISVCIMVFVMGLLKIYSPDLGFHLQSARYILDHHQFIYTDSFSYGSEGSPYYDLQWIFQLFIYGLHHIGGEKLLVIANALLITASMALVCKRFIKSAGIGIDNSKLGLFALMAALLVQPLTFEIRPHVLSWIFLNLTLIVLAYYKKGNTKAIYCLPIIMLVWANTHSLAILGLACVFIYNLGGYFEKKKTDKKLLLFTGISVAAFLVTPYFINGFFYPFTQFGIISGNSLLKYYIAEFQSPFSTKEIAALGLKYFINPLFITHLSAALSVFAILRSLRQKQFTDALLLAAFFVLLCLAVKNYGYFIMVSLPLMAKYALDWVTKRKEKKQTAPIADKKKNSNPISPIVAQPPSLRLYKRLSIASIVLAVIISITSVTDGYAIFRNSPYRFGFGFDKDQLPVEATAFLNQNHLKGKLLNHLDFGGYLMANFNEKVFIDGRMEILDEDFFAKYYESLTTRYGVEKLVKEYQPDIVLFPYIKAALWWDYFVAKQKQSGYKAVYFDGLAVIYVRASTYPQLPELTEEAILKTVDTAAASNINQYIVVNKPKGLLVWIKGLWQKQNYSLANQNKASYCFANGFGAAGLGYAAMGIQQSTVYTKDIFKNLAVYFKDKKMYSEAELCEDKAGE